MKRKIRLAFFTLSLLLVFTAFTKAHGQSLRKHYTSVPDDARTYLAGLPEQKVTLKLILQRGMGSADSYRSIQAALIQKDAPLLESKSDLGATLAVTGSYVDNRNEPSSAFSSVSTRTSNLAVDLSKKFTTGTKISAGVTHGDSSTDFVNFNDSNFKESKVSLTLSQSLWQDRFGRSIRDKIRSGEALSASTEAGVHAESLVWMADLTELFYNAWLAQAQVLAAQASLKRKERLLKLTKLQRRRGTAEAPDVLQVKGTLTAAEIQHRDAVDALEDIWRSLVISLKLPRHWTVIDPMEVPMGLDNPIQRAVDVCSDKGGLERSLENYDGIQRLRFRKVSSEHLLETAKDGLRPKVDFSVGLVANGIDETDRGKTVSEAFSAATPAWTIGLSLKMALETFPQEAVLKRRASEMVKAKADFETARSNFEFEWVNLCKSLESWRLKIKRLKSSLEEQSQRTALEERRFRLGRGLLNNVILAGDDTTSTETRLNSAEVETRKTAWNVLRKSGYGKQYLGELRAEIEELLKVRQ